MTVHGDTRGWECVRAALRSRLGDDAFDAWFKHLSGEVTDGTLVLNCPDRFSVDLIQGRYGELVATASDAIDRVEFRVERASAPRPAAPVRAKPRARVGPTLPLSGPADPTFDSFVSGPSNALALEASRAIAMGAAGRCSPLVLTGGAGVGKTHLCRAIRGTSRAPVLYRSCEEFTGEVTLAMRNGQMDQIRHRYRRAQNVLILEDLQFLEGKRATQIELFHTLDHLLARDVPVVFSADRPPHDIDGLDSALRSRVSSGLVATISPPLADTRIAILRDRAAAGGVRVSAECIEMLANREVTSVRDLLAGLNQVVARASLLRQPVTPDLVREALAAVEVPGPAHTFDEIVRRVAETYGVRIDELRGRARTRRVAQPRQFAMYLCRRYTDASLKEIGRAFARDHTSVMYAVETVEKRLVERPQLRYELEALVRRITPRPRAPRAGSAAGRTPGTRRT